MGKLVVNRSSERDMLALVVQSVRRLRLYANNRRPTRVDGASDFVEMSGGGYRAVEVDPSKWTVEESADGTVAKYPAHTWEFAGAAGFVYGYYVTDALGALRWAEALDPGPFLAANPGDRLTVELRFGLSNPAD